MKRPNIIIVIRSEQERTEFLDAGVTLPSGRVTSDGEVVSIHIPEDDPQWERIMPLLRKHAIADVAHASFIRPRIAGAEWFDGYSGQTVDQLLSSKGSYRTDSLVLAFEQALSQKSVRDIPLTEAEQTVLAIEALEREVNNGGYDQFFRNTSQFAASIVNALRRIGCEKTAKITQQAVESWRQEDLTVCDKAYFEAAEPIAEKLFDFIEANKAMIRFTDS